MRAISPKPVNETNIYEAMNRELIPLLREMRALLLKLEKAGAPAHALSHLAGGSDEIGGDALSVIYAPTNYLALLDELVGHLAGIDVALSPYLTYVDEPGATHTFVLEDRFKTIKAISGAPAVYTIPLHATIPYPRGTVMRFMRASSGTLEVAVDPAALLVAPDGRKVSATGKFIFAEQTAIDVWLLSGSCAP